MTPSNTPGPKTAGEVKTARNYFSPGLSCSQFLSKNSLPWQQGSSGEKFKWYHPIALVAGGVA